MEERGDPEAEPLSTKLDEPITELALGLAACKDGRCRPSGTAAIIGEHIALTAKHVLQGYGNEFDDQHRLKFGDAA